MNAAKKDNTDPRPAAAAPSSRGRVARYVVLGFLAAIALRSVALTDVEVGFVGVRYNNALGLQKEDLEPGYHVEVPGMHRVWRLPSSYLFITYGGSDVLSVRTKDNNTVNVDVSIPYRIKQGEAWQIMDAGNHLPDGDGRYRFQRFAEQTATDVLRAHLAQLRSEDFYHTDRRLEVAAQTLIVLNEKLAPYHLEANTVLMRAAYFRDEYETQLAQIQFNEQQKLLDGAKQAVANRQQSLDNFVQQSNALVSAKEQDWGKKIAQLDRAYQVGLVDTGEDRTPGASRRKLDAMKDDERAALVKQASDLFGIDESRVTEGHLLGIKNIEAETTEYSRRVVAEADAVSARLSAEGEARISTIKGNFEGKLNQLLNSPAGRAYVGYNAAEKVTFASDLTFQSREGVPSVLRLGDFAREFIGR
ncbi:MAG TPA: SPFH domain-containing protein [Polyangiaceae bacterium]|jgi:regulator of protease activity HflC (stomatin/prohibitin superfamily)|nr:SPFH domain-containing protein [Polyangiaceae bacterium]